MPAFDRPLEHAGIVRLEIAKHHIGSAHVKSAAFVNALDVLQARFHAGQDASDGAELVEHRRIQGERRRGLGHAVALENA